MTTRVIINEDDKEKSFVVQNLSDKKPSLIQAWISDFADTGMSINDNVPFLITPPIAKINKNKSKTLRVISVSELKDKLPKDRESVFWINVLDVPPKDSEPKVNEINLAFRTRIKLFYRPSALRSSTIEAAENLKVDIQKNKTGYSIKLTNSHPYHISFSGFTLMTDTGTVATRPGIMLSPYSEEYIHFNNITEKNIKLKLEYITELGAFVEKYYK